MKVLMLPDYSKHNPYQRELVNALEKYGVHVTLCDYNAFPVLRAVWVHGKPDVLHLHWTDGFIVTKSWLKTMVKSLRFVGELLIVLAAGIRIVWTVHNLSNHEKISSSYESIANRFLIHFYDRVIVHCASAQDAVVRTFHLSDHLSKKIRIIPHGHYIDCYENHSSRRDARVKLGYEEDSVLFLFLGSIRPYKGIFELIEKFSSIKNSKARLLIVGSPAKDMSKDELVRCCQTDDRIRLFLQYIPDDEIQIFMNASDVAVFPYTDILTSGSALLAMSFGKAIIAPRIGCIPETLDVHGSFLYDPNIADGLSTALENALLGDLDAMGQYNRINAEKYEWDEIAKMTLDAYGAGQRKSE